MSKALAPKPVLQIGVARQPVMTSSELQATGAGWSLWMERKLKIYIFHHFSRGGTIATIVEGFKKVGNKDYDAVRIAEILYDDKFLTSEQLDAVKRGDDEVIARTRGYVSIWERGTRVD